MTLRHVVMFKFKPEARTEDIQRIESAFAALASQITEVQSLEWGTNSSPEGLDHGYTHCFSLGFAHATARDAYLVHPQHQAFSTLVRPHLADVLVIDYDAASVTPSR
ncbi:MAG: Dabb family protein [Rhizobacter sp.]